MAHARTLLINSALVTSIVLVVAACSGTATTATTAVGNAGGHTIPNQGGANEGHTPTAFAGMGTGLFAGDNLNPSFPEGIGVQLYLTFDIPEGIRVSSALIRSDALHASGSPFEDLGPLLIEPISYAVFGPDLFDLAATGEPAVCSLTDDASIECPVTGAVGAAVGRGDATAQFRIRFDAPADNDGQQDLAMFLRKDSNTNESGIFELIISSTQ
jgi:hypothetical protein